MLLLREAAKRAVVAVPVVVVLAAAVFVVAVPVVVVLAAAVFVVAVLVVVAVAALAFLAVAAAVVAVAAFDPPSEGNTAPPTAFRQEHRPAWQKGEQSNLCLAVHSLPGGSPPLHPFGLAIDDPFVVASSRRKRERAVQIPTASPTKGDARPLYGASEKLPPHADLPTPPRDARIALQRLVSGPRNLSSAFLRGRERAMLLLTLEKRQTSSLPPFSIRLSTATALSGTSETRRARLAGGSSSRTSPSSMALVTEGAFSTATTLRDSPRQTAPAEADDDDDDDDIDDDDDDDDGDDEEDDGRKTAVSSRRPVSGTRPASPRRSFASRPLLGRDLRPRRGTIQRPMP